MSGRSISALWVLLHHPVVVEGEEGGEILVADSDSYYDPMLVLLCGGYSDDLVEE